MLHLHFILVLPLNGINDILQACVIPQLALRNHRAHVVGKTWSSKSTVLW